MKHFSIDCLSTKSDYIVNGSLRSVIKLNDVVKFKRDATKINQLHNYGLKALKSTTVRSLEIQ